MYDDISLCACSAQLSSGSQYLLPFLKAGFQRFVHVPFNSLQTYLGEIPDKFLQWEGLKTQVFNGP